MYAIGTDVTQVASPLGPKALGPEGICGPKALEAMELFVILVAGEILLQNYDYHQEIWLIVVFHHQAHHQAVVDAVARPHRPQSQ